MILPDNPSAPTARRPPSDDTCGSPGALEGGNPLPPESKGFIGRADLWNLAPMPEWAGGTFCELLRQARQGGLMSAWRRAARPPQDEGAGGTDEPSAPTSDGVLSTRPPSDAPPHGSGGTSNCDYGDEHFEDWLKPGHQHREWPLSGPLVYRLQAVCGHDYNCSGGTRER